MSQIPPELAAELETLQQKHADNPEGRFFVPLANAHRKAGEVDHAVSLLEDGLELHPDYLSAYIVLGRCHLDRGDADRARAQFNRVIEKDPHNLVALQFLGEIAVREGSSEQAIHWYRELIGVDPMNDEARAALAELESGSLDPLGHRDEAATEVAASESDLTLPESGEGDPVVEGSSQSSLEDEFNGSLNDIESILDPEADLDDASWFGAGDDIDLDRETDEGHGDEEAGTEGAGDDEVLSLDADLPGNDDFALDGGGFDDAPLTLDDEQAEEDDEPTGAEALAPGDRSLQGDEIPSDGGNDTPSEPDDLDGELTFLDIDPDEAGYESAPPAAQLDDLGEDDLIVEGEDEAADGLRSDSSAELEEPMSDLDFSGTDEERRTEAAGEEGGPDPAVASEEDVEPDDVVVTETMARLYMEQGLHEQAAGVLRQLLRERGDDPVLLERLHEAERAAAHDDLAGEEEEMDVEEQVHPFDASFAHGFGESSRESGEGAEEIDSAPVPEVLERVDQVEADELEPLPGLEPIGSEAFTAAMVEAEDSDDDDVTIGDYLHRLLGWRPNLESGDEGSQADSSAEPYESPTEREAEDDPWALGEEALSPAAEEERDREDEDFSYEEFFPDAADESPEEPAERHPSSSQGEPDFEGEAETDTDDDDDDDLESFQSWLQSLKR